VRGWLLGPQQELENRRANTTICFTGTACFITITFSISTDWSWATCALTVLVVTVNKLITVVIDAVAAIFLYRWSTV
jgi:hypothetical protein